MHKLLLAVGLILGLASLSAASWGDSTVPTHFTMSQARVTPDPTFNRPDFIEKWPHISVEEALRLQRMPGVVFVDGRSYGEWVDSHIPGALSLPVGEFDKRYAMQKNKLRKAKILVSYCHGPDCRLSDHLAMLLVEKGYKNVAVFWGGMPGWKDADLPLEGLKVTATPPAKP